MATMNADNKGRPSRHSHRLTGWDYSTPSAYFVTICTARMEHFFGSVDAGVVALSEPGLIAQEEWLASPRIRREIELDEYVVMPNHVHAVVWIRPAADDPYGLVPGVPAADPRLPGPGNGTLSALMAGFKSAVTRRVNRLWKTSGRPVWQDNYYDHIVRSEPALTAIREYVVGNPVRWTLDRYNEQATGPDLSLIHI